MKHTSTFYRILPLLVLSFLMPVMAWDETLPSDDVPVVEEAPSYVYRVPFPEKNFFNVAQFRLDLISLSGTDFSATIHGYSERGQLILTEASESQAGNALFTWNSQSKNLALVQSIEVISSQELSGALWLWDEQLGFFNGVSLGNHVATGLVLPYFPEDYFEWQTSFAIMGINDRNLPANLVFGYYDDEGAYDDKTAWNGLRSNGYYRGTPFFDFQIGTLTKEPKVRWAQVHATYDDFFITGYQSFTHFNPASFTIQSCATELLNSGAADGWVGFSTLEDKTFKDWFVVTNSNSEPVQVTFTLHHRVDLVTEEPVAVTDEDDEPLATEVLSTPIITMLLPKESLKLTLADLFATYEGQAVSLSYSATTIPVAVAEDEEAVPTQPLPIFAMHMQEGSDGASLGGHHFTSGEGGRSFSWVSMTAPYESLLEVYNTTDRFQKLDITIYDQTGERLAFLSRFLGPWESVHEFSATFMRERVIEALRLRALESGDEGEVVVDPNANYRIGLSLETIGTFFTKLTAFQERDFAIVNPTMLPAPVVEPPVGDGEPTGDGEPAGDGSGEPTAPVIPDPELTADPIK